MRQAPDLPAAFNEQGLKALRGEPLPKTTLSYQCELLTPMYGGGVEPGQVDKEMPIRATAIRGQLRFWWRLLFGNPQDSKDSFLREREIWGGLGDAPGEVASSQVSINIRDLKVDLRQIFPTVEGESSKTRWHKNLKNQIGLQYALFAAQDKAKPGTLLSACCWRLDIKIEGGAETAPPGHSATVKQQVEDCLRWWATFGGIGARTRRGLGAVIVRPVGSTEPLTVEETEISSKDCKLVALPGDFNPREATKELNKVLEKFRDFRQGVNNSEADLGFGRKKQEEPATGRPAGRSLWPEADVVRLATGKWFGKTGKRSHLLKNGGMGGPHTHAPNYTGPAIYPRAQFGLPLVIHFADRQDGDPGDVTVLPEVRQPDGSTQTMERRASPILFRTSANKDGNCRINLLLLPGASEPINCQLKGNAVNMQRLTQKTAEPAAKTTREAAWEDPIQFFLDYLSARSPVPPPPLPKLAADQPTNWGKCWVQRNRANGALTTTNEAGNETAAALGNAAKALFEGLPLELREKLEKRNGGNLLVTVVGGTITKLEAPAP